MPVHQKNTQSNQKQLKVLEVLKGKVKALKKCHYREETKICQKFGIKNATVEKRLKSAKCSALLVEGNLLTTSLLKTYKSEGLPPRLDLNKRTRAAKIDARINVLTVFLAVGISFK